MTYPWDDDPPEDDGREIDDDCDHDDHDIDVCTGRASCNMCDHVWWVTGEEINRELDRQSRYDEDRARWERRQWWRESWLMQTYWRIGGLLAALWASLPWPRRRYKPPPFDQDDIPF